MAILRGNPPIDILHGDGYGNGDGYGDGYGYGYGNGYGYGDGDGDGNGYGYGDGPESIYYWMQTLAGIVPESKQVELSKSGAITAFWRSTKTGEPANGGSGTKAKPGLVETTGGDLKICHNGFHATLNPPKWKGESIWVVALYPPFQFDDDKIASLKREFICEAPFKL